MFQKRQVYSMKKEEPMEMISSTYWSNLSHQSAKRKAKDSKKMVKKNNSHAKRRKPTVWSKVSF